MDSGTHLDNFLDKYKYPLAMGAVGLVLLIGGIISSGLIPKTFIKSTPTGSGQTSYQKSSIPAQNFTLVKVDVAGAVVNPGVYTLPAGSRIEEAIKAAGGVADQVDSSYLAQNLNLAQKLVDGSKIYIPSRGETLAKAQTNIPSGNTSGSAASTVINVNLASVEQLDSLPGVGEKTAQKIIDNRPYGSIEELFTKKAVNRSVYDKIKGLVSVY